MDRPSRVHLSRLMKIWRSAGWPARDGIEIDLLAANLVSLSIAETGHESLRVTQAGLKLLAHARERAQRASSPHDRLARRMGKQLLESGRVVWHELSLRASVSAVRPSPLHHQHAINATLNLTQEGDSSAPMAVKRKMSWRIARPDLFSVRNTSVEHYLRPMVHEIKATRADLLSDLRNAAKRESYQWLCCECFYVFPCEIAEPQEIPEEFGIWLLHGAVEDGQLELLRPARHSPCKLPFGVWLALAKATPMLFDEDPVQGYLTDHASLEPDMNITQLRSQ